MWSWCRRSEIFNSGRQVVRSHVVQDVVIFQRMYRVIPMTNCLRMRTLPYIKQKSEERTVMFIVTACSIFHPWSLNKRNRKRCWKQDIFRMILLLQLLRFSRKPTILRWRYIYYWKWSEFVWNLIVSRSCRQISRIERYILIINGTEKEFRRF